MASHSRSNLFLDLSNSLDLDLAARPLDLDLIGSDLTSSKRPADNAALPFLRLVGPKIEGLKIVSESMVDGLTSLGKH